MASRVFLLDRSGSMAVCRDDTIAGYNTFVDAQKEQGGTMTLVLFDHEINVVYENTPIADVKPLDEQTFVPRGGFPSGPVTRPEIDATGTSTVEKSTDVRSSPGPTVTTCAALTSAVPGKYVAEYATGRPTPGASATSTATPAPALACCAAACRAHSISLVVVGRKSPLPKRGVGCARTRYSPGARPKKR